MKEIQRAPKVEVMNERETPGVNRRTSPALQWRGLAPAAPSAPARLLRDSHCAVFETVDGRIVVTE